MDQARRPGGRAAEIRHGWEVSSPDRQTAGSVSEARGDYVPAREE